MAVGDTIPVIPDPSPTKVFAVIVFTTTNDPVIEASPLCEPSHSAVMPVNPEPFPVNDPVYDPVLIEPVNALNVDRGVNVLILK